MPTTFETLVSTEWLWQHLSDPGVVVLDASWYLPASGRRAKQEYLAAHIPGSQFFDLDAMSDQESPLPHMLPTANEFASRVGALGVSSVSTIVVYDGSGANMSAARAWWMFRGFGHRHVAVIDGGLGKWIAEERPVESGMPRPDPGEFRAHQNPEMFRSLAEIRANIASGKEQVVDARSRGRFSGAEPEPRQGLRGGHIPGSRNLPFAELVRPDGTLRSAPELESAFLAAGIDTARPVVATCGSGTSACALLLALESLGGAGNALYDGSWSEWGGRLDTPVESGADDDMKSD